MTYNYNSDRIDLDHSIINSSHSNMTLKQPVPSPDITFNLKNKEVIRLCEDGSIYVNGNLISDQHELCNGLREWLLGQTKVIKDEIKNGRIWRCTVKPLDPKDQMIPGCLVTSKDDDSARGTIISRDDDDNVEVMWAKEPIELPHQMYGTSSLGSNFSIQSQNYSNYNWAWHST